MVSEQDQEANTIELETDEELEPVTEGAEAIPAVEADVADDAETVETESIQRGERDA